MKPIVVALTCASLGISMAQARSATSTGHITFSGAIVEDACHIKAATGSGAGHLSLGSTAKRQIPPLRQLVQQSPQRLATNQVSYRWIDSRQTIDYHNQLRMNLTNPENNNGDPDGRRCCLTALAGHYASGLRRVGDAGTLFQHPLDHVGIAVSMGDEAGGSRVMGGTEAVELNSSSVRDSGSCTST